VRRRLLRIHRLDGWVGVGVKLNNEAFGFINTISTVSKYVKILAGHIMFWDIRDEDSGNKIKKENEDKIMFDNGV
jgi:hypothetical protein